jgi:hypothetical protein
VRPAPPAREQCQHGGEGGGGAAGQRAVHRAQCVCGRGGGAGVGALGAGVADAQRCVRPTQ